MKRAFAQYWKPGALAFVVVLGLCLISIWQRQVRYNLIFTFSAQPITNGSRQLEILATGTSARRPANCTELGRWLRNNA